jgi:hypothetical protein
MDPDPQRCSQAYKICDFRLRKLSLEQAVKMTVIRTKILETDFVIIPGLGVKTSL